MMTEIDQNKNFEVGEVEMMNEIDHKENVEVNEDEMMNEIDHKENVEVNEDEMLYKIDHKENDEVKEDEMMNEIDHKEYVEAESDKKNAEQSSEDSSSSLKKSSIRVKREIKRSVENEKTDVAAAYIKCPKCPKMFEAETGILNHLQFHEAKRKHTCALCQAVFDLNSLLIDHKMTKHKDEDRTFLCHSCQVAFTNHCDYLIHQVSHSKSLRYKCIECGLYKKRKDITWHIKSHFKTEYKCKVCKKIFQSRSRLDAHAKTHIKIRKKYCAVDCVECGKHLKTKIEYQSHMDNHIGLKRHQCLYCGKGFTYPNAVTVHTRKHLNLRPYQCGICGNTFPQQSNLKKHMNTHDRNKKYECTMCNKKYRLSSSLADHMKYHTKIDLLYCPECNRPCQNKMSLRVHILIHHTKEKNFRCDICNIAFKRAAELKQHIGRKVHQRAEYALTQN